MVPTQCKDCPSSGGLHPVKEHGEHPILFPLKISSFVIIPWSVVHVDEFSQAMCPHVCVGVIPPLDVVGVLAESLVSRAVWFGNPSFVMWASRVSKGSRTGPATTSTSSTTCTSSATAGIRCSTGVVATSSRSTRGTRTTRGAATTTTSESARMETMARTPVGGSSGTRARTGWRKPRRKSSWRDATAGSESNVGGASAGGGADSRSCDVGPGSEVGGTLRNGMDRLVGIDGS